VEKAVWSKSRPALLWPRDPPYNDKLDLLDRRGDTMRTAKLIPVVLLTALGLWACSGGGGGTGTTGGTTTGGGTTGGTSGTGTTGSSSGGDAGPPGLGHSCTLGANPDPCYVNYGLGCSQVGGGTCQLPTELQPCLADPGCAVETPPLFCEAGFQLAGNPVNLCVNHCNVTADCPNVVTSCTQTNPKLCFINFCGPGSTPTNGTAYYGTCNSGGTGNGTCVPFNPTGSPGWCVGAGPVALWQPCSDTRTDGGTSDLCGTGTTCVVFPVSGGASKSMCAPLCAPTGASISGPACGAGETCFSAGSVDFGFCLIDCGAGQNCPAPLGCGNFTAQSLKECLP
jgi:hypothetical protein